MLPVLPQGFLPGLLPAAGDCLMLAGRAGKPSCLHTVSISTADSGGVGRRQQLARPRPGFCKCPVPESFSSLGDVWHIEKQAWSSQELMVERKQLTVDALGTGQARRVGEHLEKSDFLNKRVLPDLWCATWEQSYNWSAHPYSYRAPSCVTHTFPCGDCMGMPAQVFYSLMQNFGQVSLLRRGKLRIENQTHLCFQWLLGNKISQQIHSEKCTARYNQGVEEKQGSGRECLWRGAILLPDTLHTVRELSFSSGQILAYLWFSSQELGQICHRTKLQSGFVPWSPAVCLQAGAPGAGKVCLVGGMDLSHAGNLCNWKCLIAGGWWSSQAAFYYSGHFLVCIFMCSWRLTLDFFEF